MVMQFKHRYIVVWIIFRHCHSEFDSVLMSVACTTENTLTGVLLERAGGRKINMFMRISKQ